MCEVNQDALTVVVGIVVVVVAGALVGLGLEWAWGALRSYWGVAMAVDRARFRMAVEGGAGAFPRFRPVKGAKGGGRDWPGE